MRLTLSMLIVAMGIFFSGCSRQEILHRFNVEISNKSNNDLTIQMFVEAVLYKSVNLSPQTMFSCSSDSEVFAGLSYCPPGVNVGSGFGRIDSVVVTFENAKGYICQTLIYDNLNCFSLNRNPLEGIGFEEDSNDYSFIFIITQEDYENAHELPE